MSQTPNILTVDEIRRVFPGGVPRCLHIERVTQIANQIECTDGRFSGRLELAALCHDIGYSETWKKTGFHPVDGWLAAKEYGLDDEIADAVLYHGGAWREVQLARPDLLNYYGPECRMMTTDLSRALNYCDLHSGPQGQLLSLDERLADIRIRHAKNAALLTVLDEYEDKFRMLDHEWTAIAFPNFSAPRQACIP